MEKILSIIVPSYNMEGYLARGLKSVLGISDPSVLDVIVVNDGSKDRTSEIAHSFERRYEGIVTVVDKENGNYGEIFEKNLGEGSVFKIRRNENNLLKNKGLMFSVPFI